MTQKIYFRENVRERLSEIIRERGIEKLLLVCGGSFDALPLSGDILSLDAGIVRFGGFSPNPAYEDICAGLELFRRESCGAILAVGGGSAIDTAKCIKLFSVLDPSRNYLEQEFLPSAVPLIAIPTTAGTGSESTRNAVLYFEGKKYSVGNDSTLPDFALLCPEVLRDLPEYQKKSTLLDALCQSIESWWSPRATEESLGYAREAAARLVGNYRAYLAGDPAAAAEIMLGANLAGRAINITATTAPHAMSYKLTSLFRIPHGHAVAMVLPEVWEYMLNETDGKPCALRAVLSDIAAALGGRTASDGPALFRGLMDELSMSRHIDASDEQLDLLAESVNLQRLKNNPVPLDTSAVRSLYERISRHDS